jgi:hypothetical protein
MLCEWNKTTKGGKCIRCGFILSREFSSPLKRNCSKPGSTLRSSIGEPIENDPVREKALAIGLSAERYDEFVRKHGPPPGCYERRCWWLKAFDKAFGVESAERLRDALRL